MSQQPEPEPERRASRHAAARPAHRAPSRPAQPPGSQVFLTGSDPVVLQDLADRIVDLNERAEAAHGFTRGELIGRRTEELIAPESREHLAGIWQHCRAGKEVRDVPLVRLTSAGQRVPVLLDAFPVLDRSQRVVAIGVLTRDFSEIKRRDELQRALRRAEDRAEERERRALARDLHDSVGQLLALARIRLHELQEQLTGEPGGRVTEVERLVAEVERRIRTLTFRVSPSGLREESLWAAAEELAEDLLQGYGLHVTVVEQGEPQPLDDETRFALFRGMRELLINVARHAHTDKARVQIEHEAGAVAVLVEDRGAGFDAAQPAGFGLFGIRDRLQRLGGRLELESAPGDGTRARMIVPLPGGASEASP